MAVNKSCGNCKFEKVHMFSASCKGCENQSAWEPKTDKVIKMCSDCTNKAYCEVYVLTAAGCKRRGMSGWSPVNVTKKVDEIVGTSCTQIIVDEVAVAEEDVTKQSHYTRFKIQPIEFCKANDLGYLEGCVIKYVCRYPYKENPMKDLLKARDYINHLIAKQKEKTANA